MIDILNNQLSAYTNEQLSQYTHQQLATLQFLGYICDRTEDDVSRWRELRDKGWLGMNESERYEWLGFMKGRYTCDDLNRVENAVTVLSDRLNNLGYKHATLVVKTDWVNEDEVLRSDMERYLSNVETLRRSISLFKQTPVTPRINERMNYKLANNIEQILFDLDTVTTNLQEAWCCSGDIVSGEV